MKLDLGSVIVFKNKLFIVRLCIYVCVCALCVRCVCVCVCVCVVRDDLSVKAVVHVCMNACMHARAS
jgi:hypothetical protein